MSKKNSNRTRDLPAFTAVPQSPAPPRVTGLDISTISISLTNCFYFYLYQIAESLNDVQLRNVIIEDMF